MHAVTVVDPTGARTAMSKALEVLRKELIEMLPPTLFFFAVFEIVVFARALMGSELHWSMATTASAVVGALIVGKSILLADALPVVRWLKEYRLIFHVLWRVVLYIVIILLFQLLEELIPLAKKYDGLAAAVAHMHDDVHWPRFWATHLLFAVFMLLYCLITALIDVLGAKRFREVFFGRKPASR
jgi:hypothetical protein